MLSQSGQPRLDAWIFRKCLHALQTIFLDPRFDTKATTAAERTCEMDLYCTSVTDTMYSLKFGMLMKPKLDNL